MKKIWIKLLFILVFTVSAFGEIEGAPVDEEPKLNEYRPLSIQKLDERMATSSKSGARSIQKEYNAELKRYLDSVDRNSDIIFMMANQYFLMEQFEKANKVFSQDRGSIKNLFGSATTNRLVGKYQNAIEDYNIIISKSPKFSEAYLGRGLSYRNLAGLDPENIDRAISDLQTFIDKTGRLEGYIALGDFYLYLERYDEAAAILSKGISKYSGSKQLRTILSQVNLKKK